VAKIFIHDHTHSRGGVYSDHKEKEDLC